MASRAALLGSAAPRSEHDPDLEAAAVATIAMQLVTGTFADPTHESAFAAQFFRLAFPCHVFLIALNLAVFTWAALVTQPEMSAFWSLIGLVAAFLMLSRVLIHCIVDSVRGQRLGSQSWTALIVISWVGGVGMYMMDTTAACATAQVNYLGPLIALVTALVNGSHGMGFAHKLGLMGLLLVLDLLLVAVCFKFALAQALGDVGAHMVGFVVAHMVEMHLRQIYAENAEKVKDQRRLTEERRRLEERNEQLRAEKERLMYDVQRRGGRPLDDGDDRSALRRGLLAGPSEPYQRADSTGSSETGAPAPSDSPPASLPPGAPSSSAGKSSKSGESGKGTGRSSNAAHGKSTVPPPHWAELAYREFHAAKAAQSRTEQGVPPEAPPQARPPTWEELDAEYYADIAKSAIEPRTAPLASAEAGRHGAPSSSQVSRTSAAATPAAPLPPRPASQQAESDGALDRSCAEMAAASTAEQAGARRARGTKRAVAACGGHNHCGGDCGGNNHCGGVAEVTTGAGKASVGKASAGRARAAKNPTTEQGIEQLQSWKVSSDPIYVAARARLSAAQAPADSAQRRST